MARKLDQVIVVDVESTCWEGKPPEGQENEIIEIGYCLLDVDTLQRSNKTSILVQPEKSEVSAFCTRLTTLTPEQVAAGMSFFDACNKLRRELDTRARLWASYGDYDRRQFQRQCDSREIPFPFGPTHLNVKNLFALVHGKKHEVGMAEALEMIGVDLEGTHHRGHDDAWNIAAILGHVLTTYRQAAR